MDNNNILFTKNATTGQMTAVGAINSNTMITTPNRLSGLSDTNIVSPATNQGLLYNSTTGKWENKNFLLSGLNDCNFTTPTNSDFIKYDPFTAKFVNRPLQYASCNITGKLNDALFPNGSPPGTSILDITNIFTSITTNDIYENGLTINQTNGLIQGIVGTRTYLITAKINLSPTLIAGGGLYLFIGTQTGVAFTSGTSSACFFNTSSSQLPASLSYIYSAPGSGLPDGISIRLFLNTGYTGITPDDCSINIVMREL
jgi:hypothetical protein